MNLKEQISRIQSMMGKINESKEKKELPPFIKRRFTENQLDFEFYDAIEYAKKIISRNEITLDHYINITISVLMDNLHSTLMDTLPQDVMWYEMVENVLKDYYRDEITKEYKSMMK
jgi:hypothetical protein